MNQTLSGIDLSVIRGRRLLRRVGLLGALVFAATAAFAQSLAFTTLAGTAGVTSPFNNSGTVTFSAPQGVAVDSAGNVYVADTDNHVIRKITAAGVVSTLVGAPGAFGLVNDASPNAPAARFRFPRGVALNSAGTTLYVADTGNNAIRTVTLASQGGAVTGVSLLAGSATGTAGSINSGSASQFNGPSGLAVSAAGDVYVADTFNQLIRKIVVAGPTVTTVAGLLNTTGILNGDSSTATFHTPYSVALNADDSALYVADYGNHAIRRIALPVVAVTTYAGTGSAGFSDAVGTSAAFRNPSGVAVDASGNVLVMDFGNNALRQIALAGTGVTTVAGPAATGSTAGASGVANGTGTAVRFTGPIGVAVRTVSSVQYVYVADTNNQLIRQGGAPALPVVAAASPSTQNVAVGTNGVTFTSTVTGGFPAPTLQWQVQPGGVGSFQNLSASSTYLNVTTDTLTINGVSGSLNNNKYRLTATSSSTVDGAPGTLVVSQPPTFASSSVTFTAVAGLSSSFVVAANGSPTITYSAPFGGLGIFSLASNGTITGTPTATSDTVGPVTVVATNGVAPDAQQSVTINVLAAGSSVAPAITSAATSTFLVGQSNSFTFSASGAPTPTIGLSGALPTGVTFANGVLSGVPVDATGSPFTLTVSATSAAGTATPQTFTLIVNTAATPPVVITSPSNAIVNAGLPATFTATISGSPAPTLRWQRQPNGTSGFVDLTDDGTYSGTTTSTLTVVSAAAGMSGDQFRLVGTNVINSLTNSATTTAASLAVNIGTAVSTFAGRAGVAGAADGTGTAATFSTPASIVGSPGTELEFAL